MNTEHKYLSDVRVRKAINMAFDRQTHVDQLFGKGNALVGSTVPADHARLQHQPTRTRRATSTRPAPCSRKLAYRKAP
jgi:ABC-type oligopeptide transport system substrate-binding subunit